MIVTEPAAPAVSAPEAPATGALAVPPKEEVTATSDPVAKKINSLHADICHAGRTTIKNAIKIGELLTKQKDKAGHGNWLRWVEDNLSFSARTASNYVRIFERRDELKSETLSDLTAAYKLLGMLAEPEQPKVRIQFTHERVEIKKARFPVTYTEVNLGFKTRAKPEPEPEPKEAEIVSVTTANESESPKAEPPAPTIESKVGMTAQEMDRTVDALTMTEEEMNNLLGSDRHLASDVRISGSGSQQPEEVSEVDSASENILAYIDVILARFRDTPGDQVEVMRRVRDVLTNRCKEGLRLK
jgi:hypothetical protein